MPTHSVCMNQPAHRGWKRNRWSSNLADKIRSTAKARYRISSCTFKRIKNFDKFFVAKNYPFSKVFDFEIISHIFKSGDLFI